MWERRAARLRCILMDERGCSREPWQEGTQRRRQGRPCGKHRTRKQALRPAYPRGQRRATPDRRSATAGGSLVLARGPSVRRRESSRGMPIPADSHRRSSTRAAGRRSSPGRLRHNRPLASATPKGKSRCGKRGRPKGIVSITARNAGPGRERRRSLRPMPAVHRQESRRMLEPQA